MVYSVAHPVCVGADDAEVKEESLVKLDGTAKVWRVWDVTAYVRDVVAGTTPNRGLMLRIVNGEAEYHARFYPETDLAVTNDPALRPRLVIDFLKQK